MNSFIDNFKNFGDKVAIIHNQKQYSYAALYKEVLELEHFLASSGISSGEVVSIISDYSFYSVALLLALYANKNIIVPIATTVQSEIEERLEVSCSTKFIKIKGDDFHVGSLLTGKTPEMILSLQAAKKSGLILFSSGTTGKPKAMIHDLDNLISTYAHQKEKPINMMLFLMFDHIGGLNTLFHILSIGATMIIPTNRNADEVCRLLQDYKIRVLPASPTFLNLILISKSHQKYDLSALKMITYGTEIMPSALLSRLKLAFPKVKFLQTFGTSETGIAATSSRSCDSTFMKLDDPNLEYKIVEGELWLKSKTQILGYLNAPMNSFTEDGYFRTGDLVELTSDGYIKIIGRNKEIINVGGEKVLPSEVESIILSMPEIQDVVVYGAESVFTGQTVVCDVVSSLDPTSIKPAIRSYCKDKLSPYKIPTKINLIDKPSFNARFKKIRIR